MCMPMGARMASTKGPIEAPLVTGPCRHGVVQFLWSHARLSTLQMFSWHLFDAWRVCVFIGPNLVVLKYAAIVEQRCPMRPGRVPRRALRRCMLRAGGYRGHDGAPRGATFTTIGI